MKTAGIPAVAAAIILAACSSTKPATTAGLGADMPLAGPTAANPNIPAGLADNTLVFRSPTLDISKYHGFYIPAAGVYSGADADFGETAMQDRSLLAQELTQMSPRPSPAAATSPPAPGLASSLCS